jgi:hypothetical protein
MKKIGSFVALVLAAVGFAGCVTVTAVPLPSGQSGFTIECWELPDCYKKAARVCGGKYEIFHQGTSTSGAVVEGNGSISSEHTITITCPAKA